MQITDFCSNEAVLKELGARIRLARIDYPLSQEELAKRAGISKRTVMNMERGADVTLGSLISVLRALNLLSRIDMLVDSDQLRPSELLAQRMQPKRVRASKKASETTPWKWGDEQ